MDVQRFGLFAIVAGGRDTLDDVLRSVEIISLEFKTVDNANMLKPRFDFKLVVLGTTLLAVGGSNDTSIETWEGLGEPWEEAAFSLSTSRRSFSALSYSDRQQCFDDPVPPHTCPTLDGNSCKFPFANGTSQNCGDDWEAYGDHCYYWSTDKKTWNEAEVFCQQKNGHLASITSEAINQYVLEGMNSRGFSSSWVGGNDIDEEGTWNWTDGSPFEFTAWFGGEPNNRKGGYKDGEDCLHVAEPKNDLWNDYFCSIPAAFICDKKKS